MMAFWLRFHALTTAALACFGSLAGAEVRVHSATLDIDAQLANGTREGGTDQARIMLAPELSLRSGRRWQLETELRLEAAGDETGLGTIDTYDDISKPLALGPDARLELDGLALAWRRRATQVTLGKQTFAWGVLDGLQVTDRLDAVRLREGVFTPNRPQRIGRWGARARFELAGTRFDLAGIVDGTTSQLALPDETFAVQAPRSRGGLPASVTPDTIAVDTPDAATLGLRLSRTFGRSDLSLIAFNGPETDPVFRPNGAGVTLAYPTRTLIGATWQQAVGARVWRVEVAHVPDQPVNLAPSPGLRTDREARWLAGAGLDWDLPGTSFLNAQIGLDHVDASGAPLVRPETDVIGTLRLQRSFANDTWRAQAELIGSLSDGDGAFRPALTWQAGDHVAWDLGADLIWGTEDELIGQFEEASRVYLRARLSV